jgi:DNA-binding MarR family transcriptional regulator
MKQRDAAAREALRINEQKWTKLLMDSGWTAVPSVILERQKALGLDELDMNILMYLTTYWWTEENKPHPAKGTMAEALGVHPRTIQRRIAAMEAAKLIRREERRYPGRGSRTNLYHFDGLIEAVRPFAKEKIEERAKREAERKKAAARKGRPRLTVVASNDE